MKVISVFTASWGQLHGRQSNMGDIIIFEAILDILKSYRRVGSIYCYSNDPEYTDTHYGVHSSNPLSIIGLLRTIRNVYRSDIVLLGGGELLQTKSSFLYLVANLAPALLSWIFQKKCVAVGVGIANPEEISIFGRCLSSLLLNRIHKICLRDSASLKNAVSIGLDRRKLVLSADLAFHFANTIRPASNHPKVALFCPRYTQKRKGSFFPDWLARKWYFKEKDDSFRVAADTFSKILTSLCNFFNETIILPVYQNPHSSGKDVSFSRAIFAAAGFPKNAQVYDDSITAQTILDLIQRVDVVVAVPLHALLMGAILQKPLLSLSYASKCRNLMNELRLNDYVLEADSLRELSQTPWDLDEVKQCLQQKTRISRSLAHRIDELFYRHKKNIASIEEAIRSFDFTGNVSSTS